MKTSPCLRFAFVLLMLSVLTIISSPASAQCNCTVTIPTNVDNVDGDNYQGNPIPPGATICVTGSATARHHLRFINIDGTSSQPITIINCNGNVIMDNNNQGYAFTLLRSEYVHVTGTGPGTTGGYGFRVAATQAGANAFKVDDLSTDVEVDHVEVYGAGFAGMMMKTDPRCDGTSDRGTFTMYNISVHDNWVHNVGGEGFYIGNSFYNGTKNVSGCTGVVHYPHEIIGMKLFNNLIQNTGCEGIQVGCVVSGAEIHDNIIEAYGQQPLNNSTAQGNGLQIGEGTGGLCYNNRITYNTPPGTDLTNNGIICLGMGNNVIFNNIIVGVRTNGIFLDDRHPALTNNSKFHVYNNNIINPGQNGILVYADTNPDSIRTVIRNNVLVGHGGSGTDFIKRLSTNVPMDTSNNYRTMNIASLNFANAGAGDYHLTASSTKLINQGTDVSSFGVTFDYDDLARPQGVAFDIGAYERESEDPFNLFIDAGGLSASGDGFIENDTLWENDRPHESLDGSFINYWTGSTAAYSKPNPTIAPNGVLGTYRYTNKNVTNSNTIRYLIDVPSAGDYEVELFFAFKNSDPHASGERRFNIYLEGTLMGTYDVQDSAGANSADSEIYTIEVTGTELELKLVAVANSEAQVNAIRVTEASSSPGARMAATQSDNNPAIESDAVKFSVSPNPAGTYLDVTMETDDVYQFRIINTMQQVLTTHEATMKAGVPYRIDISSLPANQVYIFQSRSFTGARRTFKVLKVGN